jgi:guanyl-specific ribonuclease Sa
MKVTPKRLNQMLVISAALLWRAAAPGQVIGQWILTAATSSKAPAQPSATFNMLMAPEGLRKQELPSARQQLLEFLISTGPRQP